MPTTKANKKTKTSSGSDSSILDEYFFKRLDRLPKVWLFVSLWISLLALLAIGVLVQNKALGPYYQSRQPVAGGVFNEGVIGQFSNANPIYATSPVDRAVSRLVFAGLLKYDNQNNLVGDLAKSWKVDSSGKVYTVKLKPNLVWQDGKPLTAEDVVFTFNVIQDPASSSPLINNWTGIQVKALDKRTVEFVLPNPLSSFPDSLTVGIIPKHVLSTIPRAKLRSSSFDTKNPIGSGPFKLSDVTVNQGSEGQVQDNITLTPFDNYWAGSPKLSVFVLHSFMDQQSMVDDFRANQLNAMAGLDSVPSDIADSSSNEVENFNLTAANMVFFRTTDSILSSKKVRQALVLAANPSAIISQLQYPARRIDEPILDSQFAYNPKYAQQVNRPAKANRILSDAGWKESAAGPRHKKSQKLAFSLTALDSPENHMITAQLQQQWKAVGVEMHPSLLDQDSFHNALLTHNYSSVLYSVSVGSDPDVFVYWDSSQAKPGSSMLNLSEYKSKQGDTALEAGRTRFGHALRKAKYTPFLKAWSQDNPALVLFQPKFSYVVHGKLYGLRPHTINDPSDRYFSVANWAIRTGLVTNKIN